MFYVKTVGHNTAWEFAFCFLFNLFMIKKDCPVSSSIYGLVSHGSMIQELYNIDPERETMQWPQGQYITYGWILFFLTSEKD